MHKTGGGDGSFTPTKKGGVAKKSFSNIIAKRGQKSFKVILTWEHEVLAILKGGGAKNKSIH